MSSRTTFALIVRCAWREITSREKKGRANSSGWDARERKVLPFARVSPSGFHTAIISSWFIYSLARRTQRKGTTRSLLVPVLLNFPKFFYNQTEAKKFIVSIRKQCYSKTEITCLFLSSI